MIVLAVKFTGEPESKAEILRRVGVIVPLIARGERLREAVRRK